MAKKITRAVVYTRDPKVTADKFAGLQTLVREAKQSNMAALMVQSPQTLGDTYEELIANLDLLAAADLALMIVPPAHRGS